WHSSEETLDRKRVAEHVRMTSLRCAICVAQICQLKHSTKAALPICNSGFKFAIPAPKEVTRVGHRTRWDVPQRFSNIRGDWNVHRLSCLCPPQEDLVIVRQPSPLQTDSVTDC